MGRCANRRITGWILASAGLLLLPSLVRSEDARAIFKTLDTNEDGVLSGKEAKDFLQYDRDGDGELTLDEFVKGIEGPGDKAADVDDDELFNQKDGNQDDFLSGTEVRGFEKYDQDGDGEVSRKEFKAGRAAERRKKGGLSPAEREKLARAEFQKLDSNEDGRLSGREKAGYEKLDANGDGRITEEEFVAGWQPVAASTGAVEAFLQMLKTGDPAPLLQNADPEYLKEVDPPILTFILGFLAGEHGQLKSNADALKPRQEELDGVTRTIYEGNLQLGTGERAATVETVLIVVNDRIADFRLRTPSLDGLGDRFYGALQDSEDYSRRMAEYYTPRCQEFVGLILKGEWDDAWSKYHPQARAQIERKQADAVFAQLRQMCGELSRFELESSEIEFDKDGHGEGFKITHLVRGAKGAAYATTTIQFVNLTGAIVGLSVRKADVGKTPKPATPAPVPPKRIELVPPAPAPPAAAPAPAAPKPKK